MCLYLEALYFQPPPPLLLPSPPTTVLFSIGSPFAPVPLALIFPLPQPHSHLSPEIPSPKTGAKKAWEEFTQVTPRVTTPTGLGSKLTPWGLAAQGHIGPYVGHTAEVAGWRSWGKGRQAKYSIPGDQQLTE